MKPEFNLSSKVVYCNNKTIEFFYKEDVKEFIKRLKEEIELLKITRNINILYYRKMVKIIDQLAGEKLVK